MGLDIRLPIGLMFTALGPILVVTGLVQGTFLNVKAGAAMLVFGVFMLLMGIRGQRRDAELARKSAPPAEVAASNAPPAETRRLAE